MAEAEKEQLFAAVILKECKKNVLVPIDWVKNQSAELISNNGWLLSELYTIYYAPAGCKDAINFNKPIVRCSIANPIFDSSISACYEGYILAVFRK